MFHFNEEELSALIQGSLADHKGADHVSHLRRKWNLASLLDLPLERNLVQQPPSLQAWESEMVKLCGPCITTIDKAEISKYIWPLQVGSLSALWATTGLHEACNILWKNQWQDFLQGSESHSLLSVDVFTTVDKIIFVQNRSSYVTNL